MNADRLNSYRQAIDRSCMPKGCFECVQKPVCRKTPENCTAYGVYVGKAVETAETKK